MRDVCLEALVFAEGDDAHAIQAARSAAKKTVKAMSACPMNRVTGENVNKEDTFWQRLGAEKCSAFVDVVVKRLTEMRRRPGDQALLPRGPSGAPEPAPDLLLHDGIRRADEVFRRGPQPHPQAHEASAGQRVDQHPQATYFSPHLRALPPVPLPITSAGTSRT